MFCKFDRTFIIKKGLTERNESAVEHAQLDGVRYGDQAGGSTQILLLLGFLQVSIPGGGPGPMLPLAGGHRRASCRGPAATAHVRSTGTGRHYSKID